MKLYIRWRYPEEEEIHEHIFHDINPKSVSIEYSYLYFEALDYPENKHWMFPISHVVTMKMEEE